MRAMNSTSSTLSLLVLTASLTACPEKQTPAPAPPPAHEAKAAPAPAPTPAPGPAIAGGYAGQAANDPDVAKAAEEAIKLLQEKEADPTLKLVSVKKAETQVVAGMNYRMELEVATAKGARTLKVVVYRSLDGKHQLTSSESVQ